MEELDSAILAAWDCVRPILQSDPDELAARLARRRSQLLLRPPRAWCLAVRAADRRLPPRLPLHLLTASPTHNITLTAQLLREICQPIRIDPPGIKPGELARIMGVDIDAISRLTRRGHLMIERNDSKWYGPRGRCLYTPRLLDPSNFNGRRPPDPLWGSLAPRIVQLIPDDFSQTLTRVAKSARFAKHHLGTRRDGTSRIAQDKRFNGWKWKCPGCAKLVSTVFYPMRLLSIVEFLGQDLAQLAEVDDVQPPPPTFACVRCHGVRYFSRCDGRNSWNHLIAYATAGLLYGREVKRPSTLEFLPERRRAYRPCKNRPASKRRQEVLERLLKGMTYEQIGSDLGIAFSTVHAHAKKIYKAHRAKGRQALAKKLNATTPPPRLRPNPQANRRRHEPEFLGRALPPQAPKPLTKRTAP